MSDLIVGETNQVQRPGLLIPSHSYHPIRYTWALEYWRKQQQAHWIPEEKSLEEDIRDWKSSLTNEKRNLIAYIFRFLAQSEIETHNNYMERYSKVFKPIEVRMMLSTFSNIKTVHIEAYTLLLDTIKISETESTAFFNHEAVKDRFDHIKEFSVETDADILRTLAIFGAFAEDLQLFASFAILMDFERTEKPIGKKESMKGIRQIIVRCIRDKILHCEGMMHLFHTFANESGALSKSVVDDIRKMAAHCVKREDKFIELAFEIGNIKILTAEEIKNYIRYVADLRCKQLQMEPMFGIDRHPIPWLTETLNNIEYANFSKQTTKGSWHGRDGAWTLFDAYQNRKIPED